MALTESCHVFSWGRNPWFTIFGNNANKPKLIEIKNNIEMKVTFAKISCGRNHSLLLSRNGDIYAFGKNSFAQLGNDGYLTPNIEIEEKFIDIATHP